MRQVWDAITNMRQVWDAITNMRQVRDAITSMRQLWDAITNMRQVWDATSNAFVKANSTAEQAVTLMRQVEGDWDTAQHAETAAARCAV